MKLITRYVEFRTTFVGDVLSQLILKTIHYI